MPDRLQVRAPGLHRVLLKRSQLLTVLWSYLYTPSSPLTIPNMHFGSSFFFFFVYIFSEILSRIDPVGLY